MGALLQRSSVPFAGDNDPEVRGAVRKTLQAGNPTFDTWFYVWAVRKTGSVLGPVHEMTRPRAKVLTFPFGFQADRGDAHHGLKTLITDEDVAL